MFDFVRFVVGSRRFYRGMLLLSPMLAAYKAGLLSTQKAKERLLTHFLGGMQETVLTQYALRYTQERLPALIRPQARACWEWHRQAGHSLVLVTASLDMWTRFFAEQEGFELVASVAAYHAGVFTGKIAGKNCNKAEKVIRLKKHIGTTDFQRTYAYGDSAGDKQLLDWAQLPSYKPFR